MWKRGDPESRGLLGSRVDGDTLAPAAQHVQLTQQTSLRQAFDFLSLCRATWREVAKETSGLISNYHHVPSNHCMYCTGFSPGLLCVIL
jgi:hypothetical protein